MLIVLFDDNCILYRKYLIFTFVSFFHYPPLLLAALYLFSSFSFLKLSNCS